MKTKITFITIAFLLSSLVMQAQTNFSERFSKNKNITTVYLSKALLGMMGSVDMGGKDLKGLSSKLQQMEVYSGETKDAVKLMNDEMKNISKNKSYEILMTVKDQDEEVVFYAQGDGQNKFKDLIMHINDEEECTIIRIVGNFTMEDIQGVIGK